MKLSQIAKKLEANAPENDPLQIARLATLLASSEVSDESVDDDSVFQQVADELNLRLAAASDQLTAVSLELHELSQSDPREFTRDQIWILIRAIKIQNQVLQMYGGETDLGIE